MTSSLEDDSLSCSEGEETEPLPPSIPAPVAPSESAKPPLPSAPKPRQILSEEPSDEPQVDESVPKSPEPPKLSRFPELPKLPTKRLPPLPHKETSVSKSLPPAKPPKLPAKPPKLAVKPPKPTTRPNMVAETPKRSDVPPPLPPKANKPLPRLPPRKPLPKVPQRIPDTVKTTEAESSSKEN